MAEIRCCECCAANHGTLLEMKTKEFVCAGEKVKYFTMYQKILSLFDNENVIYNCTENPLICNVCLAQLEATYVFIDNCKNTLLNKSFQVKLEPDQINILNPIDIKEEPISENEDDMPLIKRLKLVRTKPLTSQALTNPNRFDPNYEPVLADLKQEMEDDVEDEEQTTFECQVCFKVFASIHRLKRHKVVHTVQDVYECYHCGQKIIQLRHVLRHMQLHMGEDWEFTVACIMPRCTQMFKSKIQMNTHVRSHHCQEGKYECVICSKEFSSKDNWTRHQKLHNDRNKEGHSVQDVYECYHCGQKIHQHRHVLRHMQLHMGEDWEFTVACTMPRCTQMFKSKIQMNTHVRSHHCQEGKYECVICSKEFSSKDNWTRHQKLHNDRNYVCTLCKATFAEQSRLNQHMKHHTKAGKHNCEICGKTFRTKYLINRHIRVHKEKWKYLCSVCKKGFLCRSLWQEHEAAHSSALKFSCTTNLQKHNKPFVCDRKGCSKRFLDKPSLIAHWAFHDRFKCNFCGHQFTSTSHLTSHINRKHPQSNIVNEETNESNDPLNVDNVLSD